MLLFKLYLKRADLLYSKKCFIIDVALAIWKKIKG